MTSRIVKYLLVLFAAVAFVRQTYAKNQIIRVVCYNIEDDIDGATTPLPGLITPSGSTNVLLGGVLEGIGEEIVGPDAAQPLDILLLEETTSNPTTVQPIVNALNAYYNSPGMYAMSTYQATESGGDTADGNGPNALVYNTTTVQLVASVPVDPSGGTSKLGSASGEYREVMRYEFAPAGVSRAASNEFYIYVSHYKSSASGTEATNEMYRNAEAIIIRNDEALNLPSNARVLYVGDYNITASTEASYQTMLAASAPNGNAQGQGIDAYNTNNASIDWGTSTTSQAILAMETESATDLRYRDDLQIMTTNIFYGTPGGLTYIAGTYHTFGNNGTIAYNGSVTSGSDTALKSDLTPGAPISAAQLYQDLSTGSDHFPVVVDYNMVVPDPAPVAAFSASPTNGAVPLAVVFSSTGSNATNFSWTFGDGNTSSSANPTNIYLVAGTYSVTLTASGAGGTTNLTRTNLIVVAPMPNVSMGNLVSTITGGFQFMITNTDGSAISASEQSRIEIFTTTNILTAFSNWVLLTNSSTLTNGQLRIMDTNALPQRFYRIVEMP